MYFKNFPKIYYDFDKLGNGNRTLQILTDITANVRVRKQILENITLYDEYDIQDGETPEIIAEKFYGDPNLHWVIMLVNQRYDYIEDFPIQATELSDHITNVYGEGNEYKVHHYLKDGLIQEGKALLKVPQSTVSPTILFKINDFLRSASANGRVEDIDVDNRTVTILLDRGSFDPSENVSVWGFREDPITQVTEFKVAFNFTTPQNCFTLFEGYTAVTNFDHETTINESKRRIKMVSPNLIGQFIQELNNLLVI